MINNVLLFTYFKHLFMNNLISFLIISLCLTVVAIPSSNAQLKHLKNKIGTKKNDLTPSNRAGVLKLMNEEAHYAFKDAEKQLKRLEKALKDGNAKNARHQMDYVRKNLDTVIEKAPKFSVVPEEKRYDACKKLYEETYGKIVEAVDDAKAEQKAKRKQKKN